MERTGGERKMNRSKQGFCDHTWNPITGCRKGCSYCYAKAMSARFAGNVRLNIMAKEDYSTQAAKDSSGDIYILEKPMLNETGHGLAYPFWFEPTFHRYRLNLDNLKMGNNILVGAMADMFGSWVPDEWIKEVLDACTKRPIHNYLFLTKNPKRYWDLEEKGILPAGENMWYGYSMTTNDCQSWSSINGDKNKFICVEPLLEDLNIFDENVLCPAADWVIIGAETGNRKNKVVPKKEWIEKIVQHCDKFHIPVFMKDSLIPLIGEKGIRQEFPKQLQKSELSPKMKKKLFDNCCKCKSFMKKREMITLLARSQRGEQPKQFGFMCKHCFKKLCKNLGLNPPLLAKFSEDNTND